jgi:paraquat-inducible protein B
MTDQRTPANTDELPQPEVYRRGRWSVSLIWLVPVLAALVGLSLVIHGWLSEGPSIRLSFQTAQGLEAGKTQVRYKNVVIGKVSKIMLSQDRSHVIVQVNLDKSAESFATAGTRFWVVRPRIGLGGVSGIDTLLSGAFIGADVGASKEPKSEFKGLETPPGITHGSPGKTFRLHSGDLGSLDIGSPVYFRRIQVGRVVAYQLDPDGKGVSLQIFVDAPNDRFVTNASRFWNASGVDVALGANGLKLNTQSLATVLAGGVAFQDPPGPHDSTPAATDTPFQLFDDVATAMAPPDGEARYIRMRFEGSVRGLAVDAPVEFLGINIGKVVSVNLDYDEKKQRFPVIVGALLYPQRLGKAYTKLEALAKAQHDDANMSHLMGGLIAHGLRAQARTGNLLTGQLYIALDFVPNAPKVDYNPEAKPLEIPTTGGSFDKLQEQLGDIVSKIQKVPFDQIGQHLDQTLVALNGTLKQVNGQTLPQFNSTLEGVKQTVGSANQALSPDSPLQQNLSGTLEELQRAARSLRVLTDYLSVHPEALLRGRKADPTPVQATPPAARDTINQQGSKP